jgi:four helix bundle protein
MNSEILQQRTKKFALNAIKFFQMLPKSDEARIPGKQFLRSATSVAANYRAARRSRSKQEFYAKICIVVEEIDESQFWLELIHDSGIIDMSLSGSIMKEAEELMWIFSSTKKTTRETLNHQIAKSPNQ